jgi:hypothetical protein
VRLSVAILAAGLVAVAAGCGGGGSKSPSSTSTQMSETTVSRTTTGGSGSVPNFASAKNCQDLAGLAAKAASSLQATSGNPASTLDKLAQEMQALANAAPAEIRGDFQTVAAAFTSYLGALEKAGYKPGKALTSPPSPSQIAALTKAAKSFDTPKLMQAEQHLQNWVDKNCKGVNAGG